MPRDSHANNLWHYHTTIKVEHLDSVAERLKKQPCNSNLGLTQKKNLIR